MAGCGVNSPVAPLKMVNIPGLGEVAESFSAATDHFSVNTTDEARYNRHNESRVTLSCAVTVGEDLTDEFVDDDTNITVKDTPTAYEVTVNLNGDADILFYGGSVTSTFRFDKVSKFWSWQPTNVAEGKDEEYKVCAPQKALDAVFAGLDCFSATDGIGAVEGKTVKTVVDSLRKQEQQLASSAAIYKDGDCEYTWVPPEYDGPPVMVDF
jgi:hypothetical protein